MSGWPEHQKELARKVSTTLVNRMQKNEDGEISDAELLLIVDALYDTITGLVHWEVSDMVYRVRQELLENIDAASD